jgi:hypothetical protein
MVIDAVHDILHDTTAQKTGTITVQPANVVSRGTPFCINRIKTECGHFQLQVVFKTKTLSGMKLVPGALLSTCFAILRNGSPKELAAYGVRRNIVGQHREVTLYNWCAAIPTITQAGMPTTTGHL